MVYKEHDVYLPIKEKRRLRTALKKKKKDNLSITIHSTGDYGGEKGKLLLTKRQISQLEKGKKNVLIKMSRRQLNINVKYRGGFLSVLAGLASKWLPSVLTGLSSGLLSGLVEKAVNGDGVYLQKGGYCYKTDIFPDEGGGVHLSPHPMVAQGDGLFLKHGDNVYEGEGLLLGANSPFKDIPILGLIL